MGWKMDTQYRYSVRMQSSISFGQAPPTTAFDLAGTATIVPVSSTATSVTIFETIADAKVAARSKDAQADLDKVAAQIRKTACFFTLSGGIVSEMRMPRALLPTVASTYRALASSFQFARSLGSESPFSATEHDTTGEYVAEYARESDQPAWQKRKLRYVHLVGGEGVLLAAPLQILPQVVASDATIRLADDGRIESLHARDQLLINGAQVPLHSSTDVDLASLSAEAIAKPLDWSALMARTETLAPDQTYGSPPALEALDKARINGATLDSVLSRLEVLGREKSLQGRSIGPSSTQDTATQERSVQEDSRLFEALTAIMREQPRTIDTVVQKIRNDSPAADVLVFALGTTSTDRSEGALLDLIAAKTTSDRVRKLARLALARTPRPGKRSVEALYTLLAANPLDEEALFSMGTYSRRFRDAGNLDEAQKLGALVAGKLAIAQTQPELMTVLRAIANSGYAEALPSVIPFVSDQRELVRVAAVRALQSMQDPKVDAILAKSLGEDPSSEVRVSVIDSLKVRRPNDTSAHALQGAATSAADPRVRYRAVELMVRWLPWRPDLRSALAALAESDPEERIRERAKAAL
jgi:hypothetical protein